MTAFLLDTNVLTRLCHPRADQAAPVKRNLERVLAAKPNARIIVPEIADYELRRELVRAGKADSVGRLDSLRGTLEYLPLSTPIMRHAADLWAQARNTGRPSTTNEALDGDVILAAQAMSVQGVVVTTNARHFEAFVSVEDWTKP